MTGQHGRARPAPAGPHLAQDAADRPAAQQHGPDPDRHQPGQQRGQAERVAVHRRWPGGA
jgi:hypothetical protein